MQLETGKYYTNRCGFVRGPIEERESESYPRRDTQRTYKLTGRHIGELRDMYDLVAEFTPPLNTTPRYDDGGNVVAWIGPKDYLEEFWAKENFPSMRRVDYVEMITSQDPDFQEPGYDGLRAILLDAYNQSAKGKGKERHATEGTPWHEQPMVADLHALGSMHAAIFQARKKSMEACRLDYHRARCDLLGAIVYLAAAVRWLDDREAKQCAQE
jgi:hypothetical protein